MEEILFKALDKMKINFSSNEFSVKAQKLGLNKRCIANGVIANFLRKNAVQGETRRMWIKKNQPNKINTLKLDKSDEIMLAIDLIKSEGYRVLKRVSDWIEV